MSQVIYHGSVDHGTYCCLTPANQTWYSVHGTPTTNFRVFTCMSVQDNVDVVVF